MMRNYMSDQRSMRSPTMLKSNLKEDKLVLPSRLCVRACFSKSTTAGDVVKCSSIFALHFAKFDIFSTCINGRGCRRPNVSTTGVVPQVCRDGYMKHVGAY